MYASIDQARQALVVADALLLDIWHDIKRRCTKDGRFDGRELDRYQIVAYEGAVSASELAAARFFLDHVAALEQQESFVATASDLDKNSRLKVRLATLFSAEAVANLARRLSPSPADYGITSVRLNETILNRDVAAFCAEALNAESLAEIGREVLGSEGAFGASCLGERHDLMRRTFRDFARDVVMPRAEAVHRHDQLIPAEILDQVRELGCFGLSIPQRYGGLQDDDNDDTMGMIIVTEELSRASLGAAGSLITRPEILARALLKGGTRSQKEYWLPKLAAGDPLCAVAVTEPDFGSDVAAMNFRATRSAAGWLLNGTKSWCTFAGKAGVLLVLARTDPEKSLGHRGLSVFMVEKPAFEGQDFEYTQPEGGTISGRAISTIGYRGMHSYECFFDNYLVPEESLLGGSEGEGKGFYAIMAGFSGGRIQTAARAVGVMQAAFEQAISYAGERRVFGETIGAFPLTRGKIARMAASLLAARYFSYGVANVMDSGKEVAESSMVKLFASRSAEWLTREAMQIHGGMGYAEESAVSRYFLDARVLSIFEGAEEVLALKVIARSFVNRA